MAKLSGNIGGEECSIDFHSDQLEEHYLISLSQSVIRRHEVPHLSQMNISVKYSS